ncbi:MAG TPA: hypothetical protein VF598_08835 [Hymenobacter sp.]|jgi:hypothetical protein
MDRVFELLAKYGSALSAIGAVIAFFWTVIQFLTVRAREAKNREFETFHKLIKDLVEPPNPDGALYVDRQCAIMFELRFFPRYYPVITRTLQGLKSKWMASDGKYERLIDELNITLKYIHEHTSLLQRIFRLFKKVNY